MTNHTNYALFSQKSFHFSHLVIFQSEHLQRATAKLCPTLSARAQKKSLPPELSPMGRLLEYKLQLTRALICTLHKVESLLFSQKDLC